MMQAGDRVDDARVRRVAQVRWKAAAGLTVVALLWSLLLAADASATAPPTITLTPRTDLVDGSVVAVTGAGFVPGQLVALGQCSFVPGQCGNFSVTVADGTGHIVGSSTVHTTVTAPSGPFSCLSQTCFLTAFQGPAFTYADAKPLWFRNSGGSVSGRAVSVAPATGLADGQVVSVSGVQFYTGYTAIYECIPLPVAVCGSPTITSADAAGSFTTSFTVYNEFDATHITEAGGPSDTYHVNCSDVSIAPSGCFVVAHQAGDDTNDGISAFTPISFLNIATVKDDCKLGGWANLIDSSFRRFENQGDCVSFVNNGK